MSWLAQVRHLMLKDVRQWWWTLAAYASIAALGLVYTIGGPIGTNFFVTAMVFLTILGVLLCAMLVQADSPTRSNAFWASRPLYPSAVMTTKLALTALAVIGIPVVAEIAALGSLGTARGDLAMIVGHSVGVYALWLVAAIVVAALTQDLRSFVTAGVVVAVAFLLIVDALPDQLTPPLDRLWLHRSLGVVGVVGALALVARVYRRRVTGKGSWLWGFVAIACTMLFLTGSPPATHTVVPAAALPVHVSVDTAVLRNLGEARLTMSVDSGDPRVRLRFVADTLYIRLRDGSRIYLNARLGTVRLQDPPLPVPNLTRWLSDATALTQGLPRSSTATVQLDDDDRSRLALGGQAIEIAGHVDVTEPRLIGAIPLAAGAAWTGDGTRVRLAKVATDAAAATVTLSSMSVASRSADWNYAVWNDARHEAMVFGSTSWGGSTGWLLVPGASITTASSQMQASVRRGGTTDGMLPSSWFAGARLAIFEWIPRGTFTTRATIRLAEH